VRSENDSGASTVEYGLIVFAVAALISVVVAAFGHVVHGTFATSCNKVASKATSSSC
jgi:Flp pilus assembly pilin Flp